MATLKLWNGTDWVPLTVVTDHGTLSGLADDDHGQYLLIDGTRAITGDLHFSAAALGHIYGLTQLRGEDGEVVVLLEDAPVTANYLKVISKATGSSPVLEVVGTDSSIGLRLQAKGAGRVEINDSELEFKGSSNKYIHKVGGLTDANENELFKFTSTASAVNEITYANASTTNPPVFAATGDDANVSLRIQAKGTGDVLAGQAGSTSFVNHFGTSNPAGVGVTEGAEIFRTDLDEALWYDGVRTKWLGSKWTLGFGHSGSNLAASTRLRVYGLGSDADSTYELPYDCTLVGYSYSRADADSAEIEVMANASTIKSTISTSATRGSSKSVDVDFSAGDEVWARVGASTANSMDLRTLVLWFKDKG